MSGSPRLSDPPTAIDTATIDAAWLDVSKIPAARIPIEMERAGRDHHDLLEFILGSTEGMSAGVGELAGFIYVVIWRAFRAEARGPLGPVTGAAIQKALMANEKTLAVLDGLDPQSIDDATLTTLTSQPAMLRFVVDSIGEAEEDEAAPVSISPEEKGSLILLLKTAIDVLDQARNQAHHRSPLR